MMESQEEFQIRVSEKRTWLRPCTSWTWKQNKRFHHSDDDWSVLKSVVHPATAREARKMSSW